MTTRHTVLLVACSLVALSLVPTAAGAREEVQEYRTGADVFQSCESDLVGGLAGENLGSACFDVEDAQSVDVQIDDNFFGPIGGAIQFKDAAGGDVNDDLVIFCGSVSDVSVPAGATEMEVFVDGPVTQQLDCSLQDGTATDGEVFATIA